MLEFTCLLLLAQITGTEPDDVPPTPTTDLADSPTRMKPVTPEEAEDRPWSLIDLAEDWSRFHQKMKDNGLYLQIEYTALLMENFSGGFDTGFFGGGPAGLSLTADTEKLFDHERGTFFINLEYFNWYNDRFAPGGVYDPSGSYAGSNDNFIDDTESSFASIAQLYYEQGFLDGLLAIRFGKMDANNTFSSIDAGVPFQYNSFHNSATLNPYFPTYPDEATAVEVELDLGEHIQGHFGWYDGTGASWDAATGSYGPQTGTRGPSTFFDNDGNWFLATEWDVSWSLDETRPGSIGLGGWIQTGRTGTSGTNTQGVDDVAGFYASWQQTIWSGDKAMADRGGGVRFFGQFGLSDPDKNPVHWSLMAGISGTGIVPGRPNDAIGIGGSWTAFTDDPAIFQSTTRTGAPGPSGGNETAIEAFYRAQVTPWLYVQPGLEWIGSPGGGDSAPLDDDLIGYLIVGMEF